MDLGETVGNFLFSATFPNNYAVGSIVTLVAILITFVVAFKFFS